jgi:positive phototaxis protein PixI
MAFRLSQDTQAMVDVDYLAEVLAVPIAQVVPIPDMAAWVLGVYNWRGEILWVIDLGQLVGLPPIYQQATTVAEYSVLITQVGASHLGLAVSELQDMHWCDPSELASAPGISVTADLAPVLRGYTLDSEGEILLALDVTAIQERALQSC